MTTPPQRPLVIYHFPCLDGLTAAWVVNRMLGDRAEYQPLNYGDAFDMKRCENREVYLVDFCFKLPQMEEMLGLANKVYVFDHHLTAKDTLDTLLLRQGGVAAGRPGGGLVTAPEPYKLAVYYDVTKSGAGVAWDVLNPTGPRPQLITQVEFNDTHAPQDVPIETRKVVEFFRALDGTFDNVERMFRLLDDPLTAPIIDQMGNILVERKRLHVEDLCKNAEVLTLMVPGKGPFRIWVSEAPYFLNSETGGALCRKSFGDGSLPAFALTYTREPGKWRVSLRSTDKQEDVRLIAQAFGGGGHRNAAGFECQQLPWEI